MQRAFKDYPGYGLMKALKEFYFYATEPLGHDNRRISEKMAAQQALLNMMQANAPKLAATGPSSQPEEDPLSAVEALTRIEQLATRHKIRDKVKNLRPLNNDSVRLWMNAVSFKAFIGMLGELTEQHPLTVTELNIAAPAQDGKVDVDLTLSAG